MHIKKVNTNEIAISLGEELYTHFQVKIAFAYKHKRQQMRHNIAFLPRL